MENSQTPLPNLLKLQSGPEENKNTTESKIFDGATEESKIKEAKSNGQLDS